MDEDEDRRIGSAGSVNIEPFDLGRPVGRVLRGADTGARCIAVAVKALAHLSDEWFVIHLVVRRIEFELIVIHKYQGALVMLRRSHRTSIGESRRGRHRGGRSEHGSAADLLHFDPPPGRTLSGRPGGYMMRREKVGSRTKGRLARSSQRGRFLGEVGMDGRAALSASVAPDPKRT